MGTSPREKISAAELVQRLRHVQLLSLDVDGVMTDGGLYYSNDGSILRRFNAKDGIGVVTARAAGVKVAVISAGTTESIRHRAETLNIDYVRFAVPDKLQALREICADLGIGLDAVAHMGDDLNDVPLLRAIGCPISIADAMPAAQDEAVYITDKPGGHGAVREVCDLLVASRR
ncbi:MAG: HAD hydrolase family protein [Hyphomicrobiales bacterium]|nr:HAD hydrolase family protein [Hyphomicrobiales bacterium]